MVGVAWLDDADPLVRARVEAAAELFPRCRTLDFPFAAGDYRLFMREVADVHRGLFPEHAERTATMSAARSSAAST